MNITENWEKSTMIDLSGIMQIYQSHLTTLTAKNVGYTRAGVQ